MDSTSPPGEAPELVRVGGSGSSATAASVPGSCAPRRRRLRIALAAVPPLLLVSLFVVTGLRGVDFGEHWDEVYWQLEPVQEMVKTGLLMPRAAIYPAVAKWLVLLPALASGIEEGFDVGLQPRLIQAAMLRAISAPEYLLTARAVFIAVSALAIVWVYLAALVARLRVWEASVAASVLGLSWEFAYHSRWVATDCIVVQFSALTLLLSTCFLRWRHPGWLYGAAVATGLAIGTKFPTVPLLVLVVACGASQLPPQRIGAQLIRASLLSATAFLAYLVSTPATVFEPFKFFELLRAISSTYARGHYGYSVTPGWEHFSKVLVYFAVSYFSPYRLVSALLFLGVLCGGALWVRADRKQGLLLIGFPLVFLAFFCGRYSALIVRNYLLIAPFLALLLARGVGELVSSLPRAWMRSLVFAGLAAIFASNAAWLVSAAESIRNANLERDMRQALSYVAQARGSRFRLSPRLTSYAIQHELPRGQEAGSDPADLVAFLARAEGPDEAEWPANDPWAVERVFGPREVNFHWYPSWAGADRVVVMSLDKAVRIGVPFLKR